MISDWGYIKKWCGGKDNMSINNISILMKYMKAKDISLIVLGVAFIGGLSAVEAMAGLYPNRVIYTIQAQTLSYHHQEKKPIGDPFEKQCQEYIKNLNECVRLGYDLIGR